MNRLDFAPLGFGVGLRRPHYAPILDAHPTMDWFEVISENFMVEGGRPLQILEDVRAHYPIVMHGVSLSIGSSDPLNRTYLDALRAAARRFEPAWVSDHLCWTGVGGGNLHDLLPLPYTEETVRHVAERIRQVQDILERTILIENVSSYMAFRSSRLEEWEFLRAVAEEADCAILLDINNIYVSSVNHGFDPLTYLRAIPKLKVRQFHLAGHSDMGGHLIDTHDHPIAPAVWDLYGAAVAHIGAGPTMIERDDNIPALSELAAELDIAREVSRMHTLEAA
jgi:uncharacterized protein (UPF0276 family)